MKIPEKILSEVGNSVPGDVLEAILGKLMSVFYNRHEEITCGNEQIRLFVTPSKTPYLPTMQKLGLVEKYSAHKRGCGCPPTDIISIPYRLTEKGKEWHDLYLRTK